eukprot:2216400-Ditylum_brightwellii.AAC.1
MPQQLAQANPKQPLCPWCHGNLYQTQRENPQRKALKSSTSMLMEKRIMLIPQITRREKCHNALHRQIQNKCSAPCAKEISIKLRGKTHRGKRSHQAPSC